MNKRSSSRQTEGIICCITGIAANFLMFTVKLIAWKLSDSVSVKADAVHNLTDSFSCIVCLIGMISENKNSERIAGIVISTLLFITGTKILISSAAGSANASAPLFSSVSLVMICVTIIIKLLMAFFFLSKSKKINSSALRATGTDCLCDSVSTSVSLLCMLISALTSLKTDALGGMIMAIFIIFASAKSFFDIKNLKI